MNMFNEYLPRIKEFINKMPKEIADEIKSEVKRQENDTNIRESDVSLKRLCDYIALEYFPKHFTLEKCLKEFTAKVYAASFNEIMMLCEFIVSCEKLFDGYGYTKYLVMTAVIQRADKNKIFKCLKQMG